jgi:hypothetical protein
MRRNTESFSLRVNASWRLVEAAGNFFIRVCPQQSDFFSVPLGNGRNLQRHLQSRPFALHRGQGAVQNAGDFTIRRCSQQLPFRIGPQIIMGIGGGSAQCPPAPGYFVHLSRQRACGFPIRIFSQQLLILGGPRTFWPLDMDALVQPKLLDITAGPPRAPGQLAGVTLSAVAAYFALTGNQEVDTERFLKALKGGLGEAIKKIWAEHGEKLSRWHPEVEEDGRA